MNWQSIFLTLVFLALAGGGVVVVKPSFPLQSPPVHRTFKEPEDDLDEFVGQVKTIHVETEVHEFTTHFIDLGNRYKRKPFQTSRFDREGKKVEKFNYRTDGVPLPKTTYSYDKGSALLKENHFSAVSGKPYLETVYVYDSQGRLKEEIGKNIEDNKVLSRKLYTHDEKKNYTEVTEYDWDNELRGKVGFIWNDQGKVSEFIAFSPECNSGCKGRIIYDEKGRAVEIIFSRPDGSSVEKEKYTYKVDKRSNWTKKTLYRWVTEEGKSFYKLMNITYRTLTYY
jgi:hypothetical protein